MKLVLASRASPLALWQAEEARRQLAGAFADLEVEILRIRSSGDEDQTSALERFGRVGIFTVEVDRAVLDGRAHAAVHSLKDMTTELQEGLVLAGTLARGPVEDAFVAPSCARLDALPRGARLATGSRRRAALARALRPDLEVVGIRGNVETRLAHLRAGAAEGMLLARAGLERLGLGAEVREVLDTERFLPAVGQGIVGLTCRAGDERTARRLAAIRDAEAFDEALAERALLRALRGGCNVPIGALARAAESALALRARVLALDGQGSVEGRVRGPREEAEALGERLAADLLARGAGALIDAAREA